MEVEKFVKINDIDNTLALCTENKTKVQTAMASLQRILSESAQISEQLGEAQSLYNDHIDLLCSHHKDSESEDSELQLHLDKLNDFQDLLQNFTTRMSDLLNQLRDVNGDIISSISRLTEKRKLVENAKSSEELADIVTFGGEFPINLSLVSSATEAESDWVLMALQDRVNDRLDEVHRLMDEERAELTGN